MNNEALVRDEPLLAHAYAHGLEGRDLAVTIVELPERYLTETYGSNETKYLRADLDGALGQGMSREEFDAQIAQGCDYWHSPAPVACKIVGAWFARRLTLLDDESFFGRLLAGRALTDLEAALKALATRVRSAAYDAHTQRCDHIRLEALAGQLKQRFKAFMAIRIEDIRELLFSRDETTESSEPGSLLADFGLFERRDFILHRRDPHGEVALVTNFAVEAVRTGEARFLDGQSEPLHRVQVLVRGEIAPREFEVRGSMYDPENVTSAAAGALTILSPFHWRTYISHRIARDRIQQRDATVDRVYVVGAYTDAHGKLIPNDDVSFPQAAEECHYNRHQFAAVGDKNVFGLVRRLYQDESITAILLFALGTFLKAVLGPAYPHMVVEGASGVGKSTIREWLQRVFGWLTFSAKLEFQTAYRAKKLLSNSVLPIQVDEVGRVHGPARAIMVDTLNQAYNVTPSTHGHLDKRFVLMTPALMWGQDFPAEDVALRAKMIHVVLDGAKKDEQVLAQLQAVNGVWPMRAWAEHVCQWANGRDVRALVDAKCAHLQSRLGGAANRHVSAIGRLLWNYGVLLVVGDALTDFGVPVQIDQAITDLARRHLERCSSAGADEDRSTVALQVLGDMITHIVAHDGRGLICDWVPDGLYFRVDAALDAIRKEGHIYDVSSPSTLAAMFVAEEIAERRKHRFRKVEQRCLFVAASKLRELGFDTDTGAQQGDPL